ncbi:phosphatase PAP2 family protein [Streptomyces sp. NPDC046197]|uniref:phosphatase PAP2 family protein n=1 Tax=Streptomyces sp. NPDC046197 TaxID=3154337 RepID=UPI0033DF04D2
MATDQDNKPAQAPGGQGGRSAVAGRPSFAATLLGLPAVLFALITWQVVAHGPLLRLDEHLSRALVHPDRASELLSDFGNVQVAVPVLAVTLAYVARWGRRAGVGRWWLPPLAAALLMALLPAVIVPLKDATARHGTAVVPPGAGYYPSGHTATAAVAYGCATLLLLPWLRSAAARRAAVTACAVLVLGVSFGLVRRGYHWPLDVVASWCLGAVLLSALWLLLGRTGRPTRPKQQSAPEGPMTSGGRCPRRTDEVGGADSVGGSDSAVRTS